MTQPPKTSATRAPSGRADARLNRERLLGAARAVLSQRGLQAEVSEIATAAGVGAGTLYRHFPNREALILTLVDEIHEAIMRELEQASALADPCEGLAHIVRTGYGLVEQYGELFLALVSGGAPARFTDPLDVERIGEIIGTIVRSGVAQGHFRPSLDVDHAVGLLYALFAPVAIRPLMLTRPLDEIATASTTFYLAGLGLDRKD